MINHEINKFILVKSHCSLENNRKLSGNEFEVDENHLNSVEQKEIQTPEVLFH